MVRNKFVEKIKDLNITFVNSHEKINNVFRIIVKLRE